jgi:hypothetical protein
MGNDTHINPDNDNPLLHEDLSRASIALFARVQQPIFLPNPGYSIKLAPASTRPSSNPQVDPGNRPSSPAPFQVDLTGVEYIFKESTTSSSSSSTEHLSASLGVTNGNDFLNASVSGKYDKDVAESTQGTRASRNATYRIRRMGSRRLKHVSRSAKDTLKLRSAKSFKDAYGDYFIRCALFNARAHSRSERTEQTITVTVKALLLEASKTTTEVNQSATRELEMLLSGYDTLQSLNQGVETAKGDDVATMLRNSVRFENGMKEIVTEVDVVTRGLGLVDGRGWNGAEVERLWASDIVVQVVLLSYKCVRELLDIM